MLGDIALFALGATLHATAFILPPFRRLIYPPNSTNGLLTSSEIDAALPHLSEQFRLASKLSQRSARAAVRVVLRRALKKRKGKKKRKGPKRNTPLNGAVRLASWNPELDFDVSVDVPSTAAGLEPDMEVE